MARVPVEIGQSFHKTDSWIVWTVDSFNENTEPVHVRLTRFDDPTTYITVSIESPVASCVDGSRVARTIFGVATKSGTVLCPAC